MSGSGGGNGASGGNGANGHEGGGGARQRTSAPPPKSRNNCNVPQEIVTPTRRDIRDTNAASRVDRTPVPDRNARPPQRNARKPINALPENNEHIESDPSAIPESGNRFVPVRPQPRTLGLKHNRENPPDGGQDDPSHNAFLSPHASHAAVMVVNPTTPNSGQTNQTRGHPRSMATNRDGNAVFINNTAPAAPYTPAANKSNNLSHDNHEVYQNGTSHGNNATTQDHASSRARSARTLGDNLVSSCPDVSRVEQRLGQIQEYIQVTASLVENMRNSEDEDFDQERNNEIEELVSTLSDLKDSEAKLKEILGSVLDASKTTDDAEIIEKADSINIEPDGDTVNEDSNVVIKELSENDLEEDVQNGIAMSIDNEEQEVPRSCSVQSGTSIYSDNYSWQADFDSKMEASQMQIAAALQEQKYILKCQAEAKEQFLMEVGHSKHENVDNHHHNDINSHNDSNHMNFNHQQPSSSRIYGSNQIGVATTLPHISDGVRSRASSSRDRETMEGLDYPESRSKRSSSSIPLTDLSQLDMLKDLQIRRQHIENQVAKIQNLQVATASLSETVTEPSQSGLFSPENHRGNSNWEGSEGSAADDDGALALSNLRSKMAAVNVVKMELEKLKSMLRTVDSIQNSFGMNSNTGDEENTFEENEQTSENPVNQNRPVLAESFFNNSATFKPEPVLPGNSQMNPASIQMLKNQNSSHGLCRLQNCISTSSNKCTNVNEQPRDISSELASIQQIAQQMKQEAQDISEQRMRLRQAFNRDVNNSSRSSIKSDDRKKTNSMSSYPSTVGPLERKQLVLKAELEAKKKQLERLMSKEVDHRTNQQSAHPAGESSAKSSGSLNDKENILDTPCQIPIPQSSHSTHSGEDDVYTSHIRSEADNGYSSDPDEEDMYSPSSHPQLNINQLNDRHPLKAPSQNSSPDNFKVGYGDASQSMAKSSGTNIFGSPLHNKQRNKSVSHNTSREPSIVAEASGIPRRSSNDIFGTKRIQAESQDLKIATDPCHNQRDASQERENLLLPNNQPLVDCIVNLPANTIPTLQQRIQPLPTKLLVNNTMNNNTINNGDTCSRPESGSSSGDHELTNIPHAMPALSLRHTSRKSNPDTNNVEAESQQWQNPHSESHVTMWWHNKANQLQQQLEMTSNLCQSLLQDRNTSQSSLSTLNTLPQAIGNPNLLLPNQPTVPMMPFGLGNTWGGQNEQMSNSWWTVMQQQQLALQQQQLAAQQQQLASNSWSNSQCLQHLLSQQREITSLKTSINNLEQKFINGNIARPHSTPPNINCGENSNSNQAVRSNSALSRGIYPWNGPNSIDPPQINPYMMWHPGLNTNSQQERLSKKGPTYPVEYMSNQPLNFVPNDQMQNFPPNNFCLEGQSNALFSNTMAQMQLNNQCLQNSQNPLMNLQSHGTISNTHPMTMHPISSVATQTLAGQNTALNNQVPPGIRANNYWDNFRSYSRQNLLSGSNKVNAEALQTHSPHPLAERSHNTLHSANHFSIQGLNTPKRNVNNQLGQLNQQHQNDNPVENLARGRRNLSNEMVHVPPDVLNVNQNIDAAVPSLFPNTSTVGGDSLNVNLNKPPTNMGQVLQNTNINISHCNGALKKKSSTKLPAKNASNKYLQDCGQNKNVHTSSADANTSDSNCPSSNKNSSKLFDLLRDNVYSEVSALISANESRPHFLIQLFRDLQQISSDTLRQRTLQSIQELVSRYLSNAESDLYNTSHDQMSQRVTSTNEQPNQNSFSELGIFTLDLNNEIFKFIFTHNDEVCTSELMKSLKSVVLYVVGNIIEESHLNQCLMSCFNKFPGCKLVDVGDELITLLSQIPLKPGSVDETNEQACGVEKTDHSEALQTNNDNESESAQSEPQHNPELPSSSNAKSEISNDGYAAAGCAHANTSELRIDLIENVESCNGDLAEADQQSRDDVAVSSSGGFDGSLPDVVDMDEQTPTEAEAEWLRMDRVPARPETEGHPGNQSGEH